MLGPDHRLLRLPELQERIPFSEAHIWRLEKAGDFPRRVHLGKRRVVWIEAEINDWISTKMKERPSNLDLV